MGRPVARKASAHRVRTLCIILALLGGSRGGDNLDAEMIGLLVLVAFLGSESAIALGSKCSIARPS